jgi:hypothetical protein
MRSVPGSPTVNVSVERADWHPHRSDLRYVFVAPIEVVDPKSGKQIFSNTSE